MFDIGCTRGSKGSTVQCPALPLDKLKKGFEKSLSIALVPVLFVGSSNVIEVKYIGVGFVPVTKIRFGRFQFVFPYAVIYKSFFEKDGLMRVLRFNHLTDDRRDFLPDHISWFVKVMVSDRNCFN